MLILVVLGVGFTIAVCPGQAKPTSQCLSYDPSLVMLKGTLVRKTYPGPPNYASVAHGDRPETYWFLSLSAPVCVDEDKLDPLLNPAQENIRTVQLVLDPEMYKKYKTLVGKQTVATGTLFGEHTGHHHTPVLLTVSSLAETK